MLKTKDEEKTLKAVKEKKIHCLQRNKNKNYSKLLIGNQGRKWSDIFKVLKEKKSDPPRILYYAKISFKSKGEILSQTNSLSAYLLF